MTANLSDDSRKIDLRSFYIIKTGFDFNDFRRFFGRKIVLSAIKEKIIKYELKRLIFFAECITMLSSVKRKRFSRCKS